MYVIVEIAGKQFPVREKDQLVVPRLAGNANDSVTFDRVLLVAGNGETRIGTPVVPDASVEATILEHIKGDKILVFRKKRRKRFKVKRGHRQPWTRIEIQKLSLGGEQPENAADESAADAAAESESAEADAAPAPDPVEEAAPPEGEKSS